MFLDRLKKNKSTAIYIAVLFFMSLFITLINLGFKKDFIGEDSGLIYFFHNGLSKYAYYTWDNMWAPGKISITTLFGFIWTNILLCLQRIGLSYFFIQRILFFSFLFVSSTGMFYLFKTLIPLHGKVKNRESLYFGAFCSSLLYLLNHYVGYMIGFPIIPFHITYMILPWLLLYFIKNLYIKSSFTDTLIFSLLVLLFIGGNPASTLLSAIMLAGYFICFFRDFIKSTAQKYKFIIISASLVLLLSLFLTLPIIMMGSNPYGGDTSLLGNYVQSFEFNSMHTSLLNLFILGGTVGWPNSTFYTLYTANPVYIFLGYILTLIIFTTLISKKDMKLKLFFLIIIVISFFFAKGLHEPLSGINAFLYDKIALLRIYRAVYNKFMFLSAFSYSILIGISGFYVHRIFSQRTGKGKHIVLFLPIIIVLYGLPFFLGGIIPNLFLTELPKEYKNLTSQISDNSDYKILSIPPTPNGGGPLLNWKNGNKYIGPQMESFVLGKPVLDSYFFIKEGLNGLGPSDSWTTKKFIKSFPKVLEYSNIFNIKYVFLHKDYLTSYKFNKSGDALKIGSKNDYKSYTRILEDKYGYAKVISTEFYELYKVPNLNYLDHFYIPEKIIYSKDQKKTLYSFRQKEKINSYAIISKNKYIDKKTSYSPASLSINKINQTKYILKIKNAKSKHLIVFSESYDVNWKLYILNKDSTDNSFFSIFRQSVDESRHILANGYANAWIIDTDNICNNITKCTKNKNGNYDFTTVVEFAPQKYFHLGLQIGLMAFILTSSYLFYLKLVKKT
ncbi:MAG: hypothetical protein NUV65_02085 [Candidatus Roizmanbacteria bacterium]|nr:hypothetical protein [Candidatus Roizmanbacteria bacterium]